MVPPELVRFVEAELPPGASAAADVELVLTITADGTVSDVQVVAPAGGGFDEAAVKAARGFVFAPALRDGVAVAARVRYVYRFAAPVAAPAPAPVTTGRLEGRVLDRAAGEPVIGADVIVEVAGEGVVARDVTDAEGHFHFDDLPAGTYQLRVSAFELGGVVAREQVEAGSATSVTYRLDAGKVAHDRGDYGATAHVEAPAREVTSHKLRGEELTKVAGTRGDALRTIELLPGVARPPEGAGLLIVRGSSPWDTGVMMEGAEVLSLYHFGGMTSFVPSGLLESIDFYPGNFSVKYGRRMGGIVEVGLRDPRTDRVHATADINLLDSSLQVEGPLAETLSFSVAARRSYIDFWFENVVPSDEIGVTSAPVYWDWQTMLVWKPSQRDRVRLTGYGSWDELSLLVKEADQHSPSMRGRVAANTGFHRGALAWKHRYSSTVEHEVSLAVGPFAFDFDLGPSIHQEIAGNGLYGRAEWRATPNQWLRLTGGVDITEEWGQITYSGPKMVQAEGNPGGLDIDHQEMGTLDGSLEYFRPALYAEVSVRPIPDVEIIGGARTDYFQDTDQVTFDPRLVTRWSVTDTVTLKGGVGLFTQPPGYGETMEDLGNPELDASSAVHTDLGAEWAPGARLSFGVDGFYKHIDDLVVDGEDGLENGGEGRIYGAELSARLAPGGRYSGFVSYTLSRSERNDDGSEWRLFDYDQTHILSAAGMMKLGKHWTLGTTLRLVSGSPSTPVTGSRYDADRDVYQPVYGAVNSERNASFHQLDVRIERGWRFRSGSVAAYLDLQNAYNARHIEGTTYNYDFSKHENTYGLPLLPSFGVRGEI